MKTRLEVGNVKKKKDAATFSNTQPFGAISHAPILILSNFRNQFSTTSNDSFHPLPLWFLILPLYQLYQQQNISSCIVLLKTNKLRKGLGFGVFYVLFFRLPSLSQKSSRRPTFIVFLRLALFVPSPIWFTDDEHRRAPPSFDFFFSPSNDDRLFKTENDEQNFKGFLYECKYGVFYGGFCYHSKTELGKEFSSKRKFLVFLKKNVPQPHIILFYSQRSIGSNRGLLITEVIGIFDTAHGNPNTPGI
ncbi:uncharacterized protein LOC131637421 [Vicia villosa]|uniref:uncharacterized protein LOC131637421 n=1 Tax=Vicia villosa TaxID=3911 RepID=UPI00273B8467|nr:uncharacterized protein LOC131637421 [Vicia villosa]